MTITDTLTIIAVSHDDQGNVYLELGGGREIVLSAAQAVTLSNRLLEEAGDAEMDQ